MFSSFNEERNHFPIDIFHKHYFLIAFSIRLKFSSVIKIVYNIINIGYILFGKIYLSSVLFVFRMSAFYMANVVSSNKYCINVMTK